MATVKIKNIERLIKRLNRIGDIDLTPVINKATLLVEAQAKTLCPSTGTGNLRGSIHPETKKQNKIIVGRVYTACEYAMYVEFGTGSKGNGSYPYKVEGLNLAYRDTSWVFTPDGGDTFYRTNGQVAQPYMYPALKMNKSKINKMVNDWAKEEITKKCGGGN